jgi:omega-6 fatty acid desaturase (delta-12 desaturase)
MCPVTEIKACKHKLIERYAHPSNFRGAVQLLSTIIPIGLLWWAAVVVAPISIWLVVLATVGISLLTLRGLVLMHECGHKSLFKSLWLNRSVGFILGVISGMPQYVWSQHHDFHHTNNGNWEKYRGPLTTPSVKEFAALSDSQQRMYLLTRHIAMAPLGGFVYLLFNPRFTWLKGSIQFLLHVVLNKLKQPSVSLRTHASTFSTRYWKSRKEYWHMFWNNIVLLSVWTVMCLTIGPGLFFAIYLTSVSLAGGGGIILFTVQHNFEHAYASNTADWDYDTGAIVGTSFLILPRWLGWCTANIAYHHIHHLSAKIPNYSLVACHKENEQLFTEVTRIKLSEVPASLKCLLWDEQTNRIISVAAFRQLQGHPVQSMEPVHRLD